MGKALVWSAFRFPGIKLWKGHLTYLILFCPSKLCIYTQFFGITNHPQITVVYNKNSIHLFSLKIHICQSVAQLWLYSSYVPCFIFPDLKDKPLCGACLLSWLKERARELVDASYSFCTVLA